MRPHFPDEATDAGRTRSAVKRVRRRTVPLVRKFGPCPGRRAAAGVKTPAKLPAVMTDAPTTTPPFAITERARQRLAAVATNEGVDLGETFLRVAVVPGGCSGLTYDLGWDTTVSPADETVEADGLRLVLDPRSLVTVEGTTLDFTDGIDGKGFHFDNPQAVRTCACGESFSL